MAPIKEHANLQIKKLIADATKLTLILLILTINQVVFAQEPALSTIEKEQEVDNEVYNSLEIEVPPSYSGGIEKFYKFVGKIIKRQNRMW
jgi:hypothetical protein